MKNLFIILITTFNLSCSKKVCLSSKKGVFLYENSADLYMQDDMIFRNNCIRNLKNNKIVKNEYYLFEEFGLPSIDCELEKNDYKKLIDSINKNITYQFTGIYRDSMKQTNSQKIVINEHLYKKFYLEFDCVYIGKEYIAIRKGDKFKFKRKHQYLIYNFKKIECISAPLPRESF